jgi:WD40 repeat protein/serine/threonine protein kinase
MMQRPDSPGSTGTPPPLPVSKNQSLQQDIKTVPPAPPARPKATTLPTLQSMLLRMDQLLKENKNIALHSGVYDGRAVTIQQISVEVWSKCQDSWAALRQCHSPFWLPVLGTCEQSEKRMIVMTPLPETQWSGFLTSSAAEAWALRCRVVRDVAVGLYQCRVAGATHITWSSEQLYLDIQGRAQLLPGISETAVAEADDVFALAQLLWCMMSRSTTLVTGWQQGKGLPRNCPPVVVALIQACTNSTVSARPSLKALAKGLDVFWQRADQGFSDALPALPQVKSSTVKERKYDSPSNPSPTESLSELPPEVVTGLLSASPLSDLKLTGSVSAPIPVDLPVEDQFKQTSHSVSSSSSSSSSSITSVTTSISQSVLDSVLASGSLNLLLIDDQTVSWLNPATDVRYQVGIKISALRDSMAQPIESKASLPALQQQLQHTLMESPIEMLLWLGEEDEDPGYALQETAWRLWQTPQWRAFRPGDPPPSTWLPLLIHFHRSKVSSPLLTGAHQLLEGVTDFTESEWQLLRSQYALFWLVQGVDKLETPSNLYDSNELHQLRGRTRLCVHSTRSVAFKWEESTYFMPHGIEGQLLPARYARYTTDPACDFNTWEGRYQGKLGHEAQAAAPAPVMALTPAKDLTFNRKQLTLDEKTPLGKGAFGEVLRGTYYGQPVAVKRFKEAKLSSSDHAQLKDEAAVMANLRSPFLIQSLGLSLESPPLLVMELGEGGSLYNILKDDSKKLLWVWRLRVLRDIALGLSILHAHELLHRDLKSFNILLDADGRAKLCDFGLSTLKSQGGENLGAGTPLWNAPEVLQGQAATPASDVYSLAIILWEMVTRRLPYCYPGTSKISHSDWKNQVNQGYREAIPSDCPPALAQVITTCWAQDPQDRPSAAAVAQVLEHLWQQAVAAEQSPSDLMRQTGGTPTHFDLESVSREIKPTPLLPTPAPEKGTADQDPSSLVTAGYLPSRVDLSDKKESKSSAPLTTHSKIPSSVLKPLTDAKTTVQAFALLLSQSPTPHWQDKQSAHYTLGMKLQRLRQAVLADPYIKQELSCYIPPNGQAQADAGTSEPLYPWVVRELLQGDAQVLLLQGLAGAGKSTFNRHLLQTLWKDPMWQTYRPGDPVLTVFIPVFIPLQSAQVKPVQLWDYYHHLPEIGGLTSDEINILQQRYRTLWIADGYDEMPGAVAPNLYDANRLEDYQGRVKLLIGCRSQRVQASSEMDSFAPHAQDGSVDRSLYRTRFIAAFNPEQTQHYIEKYVTQHRDDPDHPKDWDTARYQAAFAAFPELKTLIDTPFMLWMTLSILPELAKEQAQSKAQHEKDKNDGRKTKQVKEMKDGKEIKSASSSVATHKPQITRAALYDQFMAIWFIRQARKAWQQHSYLQDPAAILGKEQTQVLKQQAAQASGDDVQVYWLRAAYRAYCLRLAEQITHAGQVSLIMPVKEAKENKRSQEINQNDWPSRLLSDAPDSVRLRQGCPLYESSDHAWRFIHASLLDYFMTTAVAEGLPAKSTDSPPMLYTLTYAQAVILLGRANLSFDQMNFLVDRTKNNPVLQEALFAVIERSKVDKSVAIASSNAATVLNACHIKFIGLDWQNVELPEVDLRYGQFAHSNLQGANLCGANLMHSLLYRVNLNNANLRDIRLTQLNEKLVQLSVKLEASSSAIFHHPTYPWVAVTQGLQIWLINYRTGQRIGRPLKGHTAEVVGVAFSSDGQRIFSGSKDGALRSWDVKTGRLVGERLTKTHHEINSIAYSPDNKLIILGSTDGVLYLWDLETQLLIKSIMIGHVKSPTEIMSIAFSPNSRNIVSAGKDGSLQLWRVVKNPKIKLEPIGKLMEHTSLVNSVMFSPDGRLIVSGSADETVRLWDVATQSPFGKLLTGHTGVVTEAAFSPDGRFIVSAGKDCTLRLWKVATQEPVGAPFTGHTDEVTNVAFSSDGQLMISVSHDKTLRLWEAIQLPPVLDASLMAHTKKIAAVAFSFDGQLMVSGSFDGTLRLWDVVTQQPIGEPLIGHMDSVTSVAFSPDQRLIASGSFDKTLRLWDITTNQPMGDPLRGHTDFVTGVAFSPDGLKLASGSKDRTMLLWDTKTGRIIKKFSNSQSGELTSISFSSDGRFLVSGVSGPSRNVGYEDITVTTTYDTYSDLPKYPPKYDDPTYDDATMWALDQAGLINNKKFKEKVVKQKVIKRKKFFAVQLQLWDVVHSYIIAAINILNMTCIAFSPNGKWIVLSKNNTILLWDIAKNVIDKPLEGHTAKVTSVIFSSDGKWIISCSIVVVVCRCSIGLMRLLHWRWFIPTRNRSNKTQ